jgi:signal peptidase I
MLECEVTLKKAQGELWLELVKGVDRFQAHWHLASGRCTLVRLGTKGKIQELADRPTELKRAGTYKLRFANFDDRLTVWVDNALPFGAGIEYPAPAEKGPTAADLKPAGIASKGGPVQIQRLKVWRAPYYAHSPINGDYVGNEPDWSNPADWEALSKLTARTFFVQPGHFFMISDNSAASSDSRTWGVVPERFIHYQVLFRYFPLRRIGLVR